MQGPSIFNLDSALLTIAARVAVALRLLREALPASAARQHRGLRVEALRHLVADDVHQTLEHSLYLKTNIVMKYRFLSIMEAGLVVLLF